MMHTSRSTGHTNAPVYRGTDLAIPTTLEGLWVLLMANDGGLPDSDADGRVPVMAQAGNNAVYVVAFKNVAKARQFCTEAALEGAEARMVVRGNKDEVLRVARSAGALGTLVDYDIKTQKYLVALDLG